MRLLLIEDEKGISEALAYILKKNKYGVDTAYDGITGQEMAETAIYDIIILDRMLPGKEGLAVLKDLRSQGIKTPVLILTAKDAVADRVAGLDAGADDYLVKPFSTDELLARIRALSRRQSELLQGEALQVSCLYLYPLKSEAVYDNETIKLTLKETQLLELFIRNKGQVITREQILDRVWGLDSEVEMNNVEIYIYYLRKKLDPLNHLLRIDTIRGIGYCLREVQSV
ncbi:MAG: response regulator transcription factor [Clostridiales bacterium]|nr:response regulator transcription factor [Clostridiales bacterium]